MRFPLSLSLVLLASALSGCGALASAFGGEEEPVPASQSERGVRAVQNYEDAKNTLAQLAEGSVPAETARQGMQAAVDCRTASEHLVSLGHYPETEELTTSDGAMTLAALRERCQQMYDQLHTHDLREPPAALASDPELEGQALETVRRNASLRGWDEDFRAVRLLSQDWSIDRHPVSGRILSRRRQIGAGAVWPDGHCTFQEMTVVAEHDGRDYSSALTLGGVGSQVWVSCDHVTGAE